MGYLLLLQVLLLVVQLAARVMAQNSDDALKCKDHPLYSSSSPITSVLVSSWTYDQSSSEPEQLAYLARYTGHVYAPLSDSASDKYRGLDLFHTMDRERAPNFRMFFQREARVYLFANVDELPADVEAPVSLRGWTSVGFAERIEGDDTISYGVHQTLVRRMSQYVYVFMKDTNGKGFVDLPQTRFVKKKIEGLSVPGSFNLWIAESDGSKSAEPSTVGSLTIMPNTVCPKVLHDAWMVEKEGDPDVAGVKFPSWHPPWDPCYWCAYDHEHGSDPSLLNYKPTFTYTARKNEEIEDEMGFKGFVIRIGGMYFYYTIHVQQSSLRRVRVRDHTITVVVYDRKNKELLADYSQKGDFGFESVRLKNKKYVPINEEGRLIAEEQSEGKLPEQFRSVNVLDPDNIDPSYSYRNPPTIGQYEVWETLPICAKPKSRRAMLTAVFKLPNLGIKSVSDPETITLLGQKSEGTFFRNVGMNRSMRASKMMFGQEFCPVDPATGEAASGVFYTTPDGTTVLPGPGPNAVRQFVSPGFKFELNGRFEIVDRTSGEHRKGARGFLRDHGYGIDPTKN